MKSVDTGLSVESFVSRGIENIFPSKEAFVAALKKGERLSIYLGVDPTGPTLHMGHAIPLMKLGQLQKMGHQITLLIGDFTAMIGDPTDKTAARKQLTRKEVLANCKLYKKQASKFLSFSGSNAAKLKWNSKWLAKMRFSDVVSLASNMTVDQMLKRDMFRTRMEAGKPVFIHEFLYPLMQGYDSVALDVDAEIGGNDQTFNMLAGRDLMKSLKNKEKFVIAARLLVDTSGKKMGKTEGNMITLLDTAPEMFGKVMSWTDGMIIPGFELCTTVSDEEIEREKAFLAEGGNPRDSKMRLALSVAELYHGADAAHRAKESFTAAFTGSGERSIPADAPEIAVKKGEALIDALVANQLFGSRTLFKRAIAEGAVKDMATGRKIESFDYSITSDIDLKYSKHGFVRIKVR